MAERDLIILLESAEQHKNQRAIKNKNKILKQTYDKKPAENLLTTTKKIEEFDKATIKLVDIKKNQFLKTRHFN